MIVFDFPTRNLMLTDPLTLSHLSNATHLRERGGRQKLFGKVMHNKENYQKHGEAMNYTKQYVNPSTNI